MKTIINVECADQNIMITNAPTIASGGLHENYIKFNFCEKWDGISGIAVFYKNEKEKYYSIIDAENMCEIPHEVTDSEGIFFFGVFGTASDQTTKTTKILKYKVLKGAIVEDAQPSEPTPDIYEQLFAQYSYIIENQAEFLESQKAMMENYHDTWVERTEAFEKEIQEQTSAYTDQKIADLINGAPTTMDTLKEIADIMAENKDVVEALEASIGSKANNSELIDVKNQLASHTHSVLKDDDLSLSLNDEGLILIKRTQESHGEAVEIIFDSSELPSKLKDDDLSLSLNDEGLILTKLIQDSHGSTVEKIFDSSELQSKFNSHVHNELVDTGSGKKIVVQADNNLVLYDSENNPIWALKYPLVGNNIGNVEAGYAGITPTALNEVTSIWIAFNKEFTVAPHVVATPQTTAPNKCFVSVTNIGKTGFQMNLIREDTIVGTSIHWIAMAT